MASWKNSIVICAPVEKVFAYVDEPEALVDWFPSLIEVRNLLGTGAGQQYEMRYKMAGVVLHAQAVVVEHVPNKCAVHQSIGMVHSTMTYIVEPHDDGTTLTVEIEYTVPVPVLGKLAENMVIRRNSREFDLALANVKELVEGQLS